MKKDWVEEVSEKKWWLFLIQSQLHDHVLGGAGTVYCRLLVSLSTARVNLVVYLGYSTGIVHRVVREVVLIYM